jgi:hypothetical protein
MAGYFIYKVLSHLIWKKAKAKEHDKGKQASTKAETQKIGEYALTETEKQNENEQASTEADKHKNGEQASVEAEKHIEDDQASTQAGNQKKNNLTTVEVEKQDVGELASAKSTAQYDYLEPDPGNIRLIHILPSIGYNDIIECKMTPSATYHSYRADFQPYDALSYEWADARNVKEIILDGKTFYIRENLWHAMRRLRSDKPVTFWIDAICIDQTNISERNHQVSQMSKIYANARRVIVWLGMESPSSWKAFSCIGNYSRDPISWPAAIADDSWEALVELCDRSYWHRLWIIQEVVLAKELQIFCGYSGIHWQELEKVCKNLSSIPELDGDPPIFKKVRTNIAFQLVRIREARGRSQTTLRELLETCEKSLCADPRDKIYGLLGLAEDTRRSLSVDYSKSLFDIYKDVVRFQWDIDFCSVVSFSQFLQWYLWNGTSGNQGDCTASLRLEASQNDAGHIISAAGILRGTVFSRGPKFGGTAETRNAWISTIASRFPYQGSDLKKQAAQLVASYHENETTEMNRIVYLNGFVLNGLSKSVQPSELENKLDVHSSGEEAEVHGNPLESHPRLFALNNGQVGLGPNEIQIGDCVCQFLNCDVAAILRPNGRGYKLIGRVLVAADEDFVSTYNSKYCRQRYDIPKHSSLSEYRDHITVYLDIISLQLLTR